MRNEQKSLSWRWLTAAVLLCVFGVALYLRIGLAYGQVFVGDTVKFNSTDAYYFLRYIDNFVHNFPIHITFDPYLNYPAGQVTGPTNFFVYFLGGIIWLCGLGSPSAHLTDIIAACFPAVLGALMVIPVYFIGKSLFDRKVGLIAAALIAILPGEYLGRSSLGYADRDAMELLFTTVMMLFLILAINNARENHLTFRRLNKQNLSALTKPISYSILSGIFLGLSVLTWRGSFIFVLIILVYFFFRSLLAHLKNESFDYLSITSGVIFLIGLIIFAASSRNLIYSAALTASFLVPLISSGLSWILSRRRITPFYYPVAIIGLGLLGIVIFYAASPSLLRSMLDQFSVFIPNRTSTTVAEMESMLFPGGHFTLKILWSNYTTAIFLSIISLFIISYRFFRRSDHDQILIITWSLITLLATCILRRIAIFYAINAALLTGYCAMIIYYVIHVAINYIKNKSYGDALPDLLNYTGSKVPAARPLNKPQNPREQGYYEILGVARNATLKQIKKAHGKLASAYQSGGNLNDESRERLKEINRVYATLSDPRKRAVYDHSEYSGAQKQDTIQTSHRAGFRIAGMVNGFVAGVVIFSLIFFPNFKWDNTTIKQALPPSNAWQDALVWLKANTPEPFGKSDYYYQSYQTPFKYPDTAYSIAAWWDYGYWILRTGQRIPICDPGGGARESVARFFTSQNETEANEIANALNLKYIIIDGDTILNIFPSVATYADISSDQFVEWYSVPSYNNRFVSYFYPRYFQSMAARLYYYDGKDIISNGTSVISYVTKKDKNGAYYKEIKDTKTFLTYAEAAAFVAAQPADNYKIANYLPPTNPISLQGLQHYKLVYASSQNSLDIPVNWNIPAVKIFEYVK